MFLSLLPELRLHIYRWYMLVNAQDIQHDINHMRWINKQVKAEYEREATDALERSIAKISKAHQWEVDITASIDQYRDVRRLIITLPITSATDFRSTEGATDDLLENTFADTRSVTFHLTLQDLDLVTQQTKAVRTIWHAAFAVSAYLKRHTWWQISRVLPHSLKVQMNHEDTNGLHNLRRLLRTMKTRLHRQRMTL
jgi:hypothetical protein